MRFRSLRARLLVTSGALVLALTMATVAYVSFLANRTVGARLADELERTRLGVVAAEAEQFARLELFAGTLASFPELRALLATDTATIRDFLADYRQRHDHQGLLLALDPSGNVVARSDSFAPLELSRAADRWLAPLAEGRPARGFITIDGTVYHAAGRPAESGGTVYGVVLAASAIDDRWATSVRNAVGADVVVLSHDGVEGSSLPRSRLPWTTAADLPPDITSGPANLRLTGERFQVIDAQLEPPGPRRTVILQSRDQALAPYRDLQVGLLGLGVVAALLGLLGSAWLARSMTAPIAQLLGATRRVAEGDFDGRLDVPREDEIGQLARAFNQMTAGLRERADMARFVSASTVEMIQEGPGGATTAGRSQELTVLFTDIRGFTSFAGARSPEDAVAALNRYLSLQADLVKRFHGDVDKFTGDGLFAHFTASDMALDAIRCGLEIQRSVSAAASDQGTILRVGVGIATGQVIVGSIGSRDRRDYTAIGPAVNLGARLCAAAGPGQILMCADTHARVSGLVAATPLPPIAVKGYKEPVAVFQMSGG